MTRWTVEKLREQAEAYLERSRTSPDRDIPCSSAVAGVAADQLTAVALALVAVSEALRGPVASPIR
jgi:hypothetical protein